MIFRATTSHLYPEHLEMVPRGTFPSRDASGLPMNSRPSSGTGLSMAMYSARQVKPGIQPDISALKWCLSSDLLQFLA